jgi:hypothetical protein
MTKNQLVKDPYNYCLRLIESLSRDEKKNLIEKIHFSIIRVHERRARAIKRQGKDIWSEWTPKEVAVYMKDTGNYFD